MRRLTLLLALAVAACGSNPVKPGSTDPGVGWGGNITFSQAVTGSFVANVTWQGTVFWEDSLAVDLTTKVPVFGVKSGSVSVSYDGTSPCAAHGPQGVADVSINPQRDSKLTVQSDGSYTGSFHATATISVKTTCQVGTVTDDVFAGLDLTISGKGTTSRINGTMTPVVVAGTTYTGTWDFTRLTQARQP